MLLQFKIEKRISFLISLREVAWYKQYYKYNQIKYSMLVITTTIHISYNVLPTKFYLYFTSLDDTEIYLPVAEHGK